MAEKAGSLRAQSVFSGDGVSIIADHRERQSRTCEWLKAFDAKVIERQLEVADYIVSDRVGIERKTVTDFLQSLIDQRLFRQLEELTASFAKPLLILEGDQKMLFTERKLHPNTVHGVLSSITLDYGIPIIWTHSPKVTAGQIYWTACREQGAKGRGLQTRACKKSRDMPSMQEFLVAGLPSVNSVLSKRLLSHFGSVSGVFSVGEDDLVKVEGIGRKKARDIWCMLNTGYGEGDASAGTEQKRKRI